MFENLHYKREHNQDFVNEKPALTYLCKQSREDEQRGEGDHDPVVEVVEGEEEGQYPNEDEEERGDVSARHIVHVEIVQRDGHGLSASASVASAVMHLYLSHLSQKTSDTC